MDDRIGEHEKIVDALRESEETMRYIIRHDPNAIAVYDCNLHYIAVSDRYLNDYNVTEKDIIGKHHYEVFPDMPEKWRQVHQRCLAGAIETNEDDLYERADGSITYNRWECRPWYHLNGEIGGIITYTEVITERKRVERALSESEERYRYMFTHNPQPMWIYDLQTLAFLEVNDAAVNHYGYTREEFTGMTLKDIRPVEDIPLLLDSIQTESPYQSPKEGIKHLKKSGEVIFVEITAQIISFNGQPARHVLINDITERRNAEEKLKHVTRLYAVLSQINQTIVHTRNPEALYHQICKIAVDYGQFRMAWIGLLDEEVQKINPVASEGFDNGYVATINITTDDNHPTGQGPVGIAARTGKIVTSADILTDSRMAPWKSNALSRGYRSLAAVPFSCKGKTIGVLTLYSKDIGFFTEDEQQLLQEIGEDISFALDAMATENQNKLTLEALSSSETHYRRLFESSMDGILIVDGETGIITDINPTLVTMCGYPREQFLQKSIYENQFFKDLFSDGSYLMEIKEKDYVRYDDVMLETREGRKLYVEFVSNIYFVDKKKVIKCNFRDITERKLADLRLKDALIEAQRFRQTLDHVPSHIYMKDLQSRYVYANKHTLDLFDCSAKEIAGCDDTHFFPRNIAKKLREADLRVFDGAEAAEEIDVIDKSGVRHVYWELKVPIYNTTEDKTVWGLLGISTDITERKLAEEKLRESEERFRELYDNAKIGMYRTTLEGNILMANKALVKMLGYETFEQLYKVNIANKSTSAGGKDITHYNKRNEFLEKFNHANELADWEATWNHADGSEIFVRESARAIRDLEGNILYFDGVVEDITERKRAKMALRESEAYLRTLVQTIPDLIWLKDVNGVFLKCNPMFERNMGVREGELIGKTDFDIFEPAKAEALRQTDLKVLEAGKPLIFEEWNINSETGQLVYMETTKTPMYDANGTVMGILGIAHNITHRKLAEKELIEAKEKAEESDRLKSSFLANMSHEVRTPLNSILGFSTLLADLDFEDEQKNEFIRHIIRNGNNLLNIINDIMDISKIESGEIKIHKGPVEAEKFVSGIKDQFIFQTKEKELEIKLNIPESGAETIVYADKDRLHQVLSNLISNAVKFTPNGHIEIGYQPKGEEVEFFVKDTGIGIPQEFHDKIFQRFRQVETEKTRKYGGNGLGLAITKNLLELMDGRIWLNSEPGQGSAFHFTLPVYSGED